MKRVAFMAQCRSGSTDVLAYANEPDDNFVVHRTLETLEAGLWTISHRNVGLRVPYLFFATLSGALSAAQQFNKIPGWRKAFFDRSRLNAGGVSSVAKKRASRLIKSILKDENVSGERKSND